MHLLSLPASRSARSTSLPKLFFLLRSRLHALPGFVDRLTVGERADVMPGVAIDFAGERMGVVFDRIVVAAHAVLNRFGVLVAFERIGAARAARHLSRVLFVSEPRKAIRRDVL